MFELSKELGNRAAAGHPIHTSVVGAGSMGTLFAQSLAATTGICVDVICDLLMPKAMSVMESTGVKKNSIVVCETLEEADKALASGKKVVTSNLEVACSASVIDVVCESTGNPDAYVKCGIFAFKNKKHFVTMNVEMDVCIGHLMNMWAKQAGVVYTGIYGDEPGNAMLLYEEAKLTGLEVVAIGRSNMGGSNLSWNKETIKPMLKKMGLELAYPNTALFASFCDGSKTNEECCSMANATGFRPDVRGMHGPKFDSWYEVATKMPTVLCPQKDGGILNNVGVVEYVDNDILEGIPNDQNYLWQFVVVKAKTPTQIGFIVRAGGIMKGDYGILYSTYHREAAQAPVSVAVAAIDGRAVVAPLEGNKRAADVVTLAKKDLTPGEVIDEMGGFCTAGRIECASITRNERLLPFALAAGAVVKKAVSKGSYLTYDDVEFVGKPSLVLSLRRIQDIFFGDLW